MKTTIKTIGFAFLAIFTMSAFGAFVSKNDSNLLEKESFAADAQILVGIGYRNKMCGSSVQNGFSEAVGYEYGVTSDYGGYDAVIRKIETKLTAYYRVEQSSIHIKSSTRSNAVIISYDKEIAGWGCSVTRYAVGFGDGYEAALEHAVSKKNNDTRSGEYWVIQRITK